MYTRIVLESDVWFVVDESMDEIVEKFNDSLRTITANVIDGYEVSVIKDKILCFVAVSITDEVNIEISGEEDSL